MRLRTASVVALAGFLLAAACSTGKTPFNDPDALVVAMHAGFTDQVVAAAEPWQQAHPEVKLSLAPYAPADFSQAMIPRLLTGSNVPDVIVVDAAFLGVAARGGMLDDLSAAPFSAEPLLAGYPAGAVAQGRNGAALAGVPADVAPTVLFYRKDLLDAAGVAEAELTRSWESFVEACGKLQAKTRSYCVPRLWELADLVMRAEVPAGQSLYFSPAGEPLAAEAPVAHAFALARAAHDARIDAGPSYGSEAWVELVRRGYFAVVFGGPTTVRRLEVMSPGTAGQWRAAPMPGGVRLPASSAYCALGARAAGGARKARAWDFIQRVCLDRHAQLQAWRAARAVPASPAAAASPSLEEPLPFLGGQAPGPAWRAAGAALPVPGAHPLDAFARDAVALELDYAVQENKDFAKAMADARARIRRQMERTKKK
jgi:multiple sugar transport system substrate-binding protein